LNSWSGSFSGGIFCIFYENCGKKIHDPGAGRRDVGEGSGVCAIKNLTISFGAYTVERE